MAMPAIDPAEFKSLETLNAHLDEILASAPKDEGGLDLIVMRSDHGVRVLPEKFEARAERSAGRSLETWGRLRA